MYLDDFSALGVFKAVKEQEAATRIPIALVSSGHAKERTVGPESDTGRRESEATFQRTPGPVCR